MPGRRDAHKNRHPGGGGRLSATTKRSISAKQRQMTKDGQFRHPGGGGRLSATTKRSISAKQRQMTKDGHFRHPGGGGSRA
ncbi:MAG: hypothetical protein PUB55_09490 [Bacteroidales bacterium]|nr:hypothetical protein [Bacteroidales bacterium]